MLPVVDKFNLPRQLGGGITLRWGRPGDAEGLAEFNGRIHSSSATEPDVIVANWTRDFFSGRHPTTKPSDFLVAVDENRGGKIVSSLNLISQTWSYGGIPFGVGRPEIVGTDPDYRRKGLVRTQFEIIHALSASRGEMVQVITGIPYFYRQYNYSMALDLSGGRRVEWYNVPKLEAGKEELYRLRQANYADIPVLAELYNINCASSMVSRIKDDSEWRYELSCTNEKSAAYCNFMIIETLAGEVAGYVEVIPSLQTDGPLVVREFAVRQGYSLRAVSIYLLRALKALTAEWNKNRQEPLIALAFSFGEYHPVYTALGNLISKVIPPYAFYVRVADLPAFLMHIRPVLERRLVGSVMENHTGTLRLNFYTSNISLTFDNGKLKEVAPYQANSYQDGDCLFPGLTFLELLFGRRSLEEIRYAHPDCAANNGGGVLLDVLFPRKPSHVVPLS